MVNVLFVCHGNICRSTMAEFLCKYMVKNLGLDDKFYIESCATSSEEIGNPVHYGTAKVLDQFHIDYFKKRARQITKLDYDKFDYIIGMDDYNKMNLLRFFNGDKDDKISLLLDYTDDKRDVKDPWYTGNFEETFNDVIKGLNGFLHYLKEKDKI